MNGFASAFARFLVPRHDRHHFFLPGVMPKMNNAGARRMGESPGIHTWADRYDERNP